MQRECTQGIHRTFLSKIVRTKRAVFELDIFVRCVKENMVPLAFSGRWEIVTDVVCYSEVPVAAGQTLSPVRSGTCC